jgi:hypothetical protein
MPAGHERRQRARRRRRGAADGGDLLLGDDGHQRGDEISLGREIAVDGAGGEAGAFRHRDDLHRAHPAFARQRPRGRDYGLMAGGKTRDYTAPAGPPSCGEEGQCWRASAASRILVSVVAGVVASGSTLR